MITTNCSWHISNRSVDARDSWGIADDGSFRGFNQIAWTWRVSVHHRCFSPNLVLCRIHPHDDVIKWKHFPRCCPFVRGIRRSPVNSMHKDQWQEALTFPLICAWKNVWASSRKAGILRRQCAHYGVIAMEFLAARTRDAGSASMTWCHLVHLVI